MGEAAFINRRKLLVQSSFTCECAERQLGEKKTKLTRLHHFGQQPGLISIQNGNKKNETNSETREKFHFVSFMQGRFKSKFHIFL